MACVAGVAMSGGARDAHACTELPPRVPGAVDLQLVSRTIPRDGGVLLRLTQDGRPVDAALAALSLALTVDGKEVAATVRELGRTDAGDTHGVTLILETTASLTSTSRVAVRASGLPLREPLDTPVTVSDVTLADLTTNAAASLSLSLGRVLPFGDGAIRCTLAEPEKGEDSCGTETTTTERTYRSGFSNLQEVVVATRPPLPPELVTTFTKTSLVDLATGQDEAFVGEGTRFVLPKGAVGRLCYAFRAELVTRPGEVAEKQVCLDAPALAQPSPAEKIAYAKDDMKGAKCASLANLPPYASQGDFDEFLDHGVLGCSTAPGHGALPGLGSTLVLGAVARLVTRSRRRSSDARRGSG